MVGPYLYYKVQSRYNWKSNNLTLPVAYTTGQSQQQTGPGYNLPLYQRQPVEIVKTAGDLTAPWT
jgi:hypothetical protein